jgi:NAD+ kinase
MQTIGIMANPGKELALEFARSADIYLRDKGVHVLLQHHVATACGFPQRGKADEEITNADAVLVLGGDGTILATSRECAPKGTPILAVHLGRFGFLTEVSPSELTLGLDKLLAGDYTVQERLMLAAKAVCADGAHDQDTAYALNDIVIANGPLSRVLHLATSVNGKYVTTYAADGIIIATPTGSTAYSLSAGGPLVHPSLQTLLVTPICAHTLMSRALLLPPDDEISVTIDPNTTDPAMNDVMQITVDGQVGFALQPGDTLRIRKSPFSAKLISVGGADFYDKLQSKLRWGERMVY